MKLLRKLGAFIKIIIGINMKKRYLIKVEKEIEAESEDEARDIFLDDVYNLAKYTMESELIDDIPF